MADMHEAGRKAAATRKSNKDKWIVAGKKSWVTRRANAAAAKRSEASRKAHVTRKAKAQG